MRGALVGLAVALLASSVSAMTVDFSFSGTNGNLTSPTAFNGSPSGTVTAYAITTDGSSPNNLRLRQTADGLGVRFQGDNNTGQIDNSGFDEAIVFDFGVKALFGIIKLRLAGPLDQFRIFGTNTDFTAGSSSFATLAGSSTLLGSDTGCFGGNVGLCTINFSLAANLTPFRYLIAAVPETVGLTEDSFAVHSIHDVAPVPVPLGGVLAITALGVFFGLRRRTAV